MSISYTEIDDLITLILTKTVMGNKVFVYGAGRSGFIGRCFAQRLMHLDINACFLSDAITYAYTQNDLLIIISGSGETTSSKAIALKAYEIGGEIVVFTGNLNSTIAKLSDIKIHIIGKGKAEVSTSESLAPYTSLFDISTLAIVDSIARLLMDRMGITEEYIDKTHATVE